jgi:hypothetical protein
MPREWEDPPNSSRHTPCAVSLAVRAAGIALEPKSLPAIFRRSLPLPVAFGPRTAHGVCRLRIAMLAR